MITPHNKMYTAQLDSVWDRIDRAGKRIAIFELMGKDALRRAVIKKMCEEGVSANVAKSHILAPLSELKE